MLKSLWLLDKQNRQIFVICKIRVFSVQENTGFLKKKEVLFKQSSRYFFQFLTVDKIDLSSHSPSSVDGLLLVPVGSYKDIDAKIEQGTKSRTVASTNMNATSRYCHYFSIYPMTI